MSRSDRLVVNEKRDRAQSSRTSFIFLLPLCEDLASSRSQGSRRTTCISVTSRLKRSWERSERSGPFSCHWSTYQIRKKSSMTFLGLSLIVFRNNATQSTLKFSPWKKYPFDSHTGAFWTIAQTKKNRIYETFARFCTIRNNECRLSSRNQK